MSMPGPNEVLQRTGSGVAPVIPEAVRQAGVTPVNEAQELQRVHESLADQQVRHAGAAVPVVTDHNITTGTISPITISTEEPTDKKTTHWWDFRRRKKLQEQGKETQDAG